MRKKLIVGLVLIFSFVFAAEKVAAQSVQPVVLNGQKSIPRRVYGVEKNLNGSNVLTDGKDGEKLPYVDFYEGTNGNQWSIRFSASASFPFTRVVALWRDKIVLSQTSGKRRTFSTAGAMAEEKYGYNYYDGMVFDGSIRDGILEVRIYRPSGTRYFAFYYEVQVSNFYPWLVDAKCANESINIYYLVIPLYNTPISEGNTAEVNINQIWKRSTLEFFSQYGTLGFHIQFSRDELGQILNSQGQEGTYTQYFVGGYYLDKYEYYYPCP